MGGLGGGTGRSGRGCKNRCALAFYVIDNYRDLAYGTVMRWESSWHDRWFGYCTVYSVNILLYLGIGAVSCVL